MGMAVLRFSRDKRGYEHFYLVQPPEPRGRGRAAILYWFRTPPNVRVGREPFDPAIRRTLESQYPEVSFDWKKYAETAFPRVDLDRERREAVRAAQANVRLEPIGDDAAEAEREESASTGGPPLAPELAGLEQADGGVVEEQATVATGAPTPERTGRRRRHRRG